MFSKIVVIAVVATVAALPAAAGIITLDWSGGAWNDGGSLSGAFSVSFDDVTGAPLTLLSANVMTGNASDGFIGQNYLFNVPGQTNTVSSGQFDATQYGGAPADELVLQTNNGYTVFLDWQSTSPTTLWLGNVNGQYSSENNYGSDSGTYLIRSLNSAGGSVGSSSSTPEPASLSMLGSGLIGLGIVFRRLRTRRESSNTLIEGPTPTASSIPV